MLGLLTLAGLVGSVPGAWVGRVVGRWFWGGTGERMDVECTGGWRGVEGRIPALCEKEARSMVEKNGPDVLDRV